MILKPLLILGGTISLFIGIAGIFLPILPTTPFFLITAGLYVRSSPYLYNKFVSNKHVNSVLEGKASGVSTGIRNAALIIMWGMIIITSAFMPDKPVLIIMLIILGIAGTFFKIRFFRRKRK